MTLPVMAFGKYLLDAELAQGGMARVFRARLRGPGGFEKRLVVKQVLDELARDPAFIELFVREANTLVQMSHPNVVPVYELGVVDGVYFLAMELVEGATVAELLRDGPLPEALVAHVGAQVCEALRYAHDRFGLVHRDVTPRNVMADEGGHVRLLDFGIAAPAAGTGHGERFGSPGYMSPEQARGAALSPRSDLFSLGAVLFEALSGQPAFPGHAPDTSATPQPALDASVSPELAALVRALLAPEPSARPSSAAEVAARLRTWLAQKHPEGVTRTLAGRVELARTRPTRPSARPPAQVDSRANATPRVTRSIATSKTLSELLSGSTEALPARAPSPVPAVAPATPPGDAIATTPGSRRAAAIAFLATALLALSVSAWFLRFRPQLARSRSPAAAIRDAPAPAARPAPSSASTSTSAPPLAPAPAPSPAPSTQAAPPRATDPAGARGRLSVNATPWAELRLDGRALGTTPKRALSIAAGAHLLQLECPPLGRSARVPLKLRANEHLQVVVDLNADPPKVVLR